MKPPLTRKVISVKAVKVQSGCQIEATSKSSRCQKYEHCKHKSECLDAAIRWPGFKCVNGHPGFEEEYRQLETRKSDDDNFLWAMPVT